MSEEKLHAYLDRELDATASVELEREMAQNPALRASYERLRELSGAIREKADYHAAPRRFTAPERKPRTWLLAPAFAMVLAIGIALGVFLAQPREEEPAAAEAVSAHVRATLAGHLVDVPSSDQHTVKPWLSTRLPFSPPVADLSSDGYPLVGARVDHVAGQSVAALVYKRREHVIDVFISPAAREAAPASAARDGFNVERFARGGMRYVIVSDLNRNELDDFAKLLAAR